MGAILQGKMALAWSSLRKGRKDLHHVGHVTRGEEMRHGWAASSGKGKKQLKKGESGLEGPLPRGHEQTTRTARPAEKERPSRGAGRESRSQRESKQALGLYRGSKSRPSAVTWLGAHARRKKKGDSGLGRKQRWPADEPIGA